MPFIAELWQIGLDDVFRFLRGLVTILSVLFKEIGGSPKGLFLLRCLQHFRRILLY